MRKCVTKVDQRIGFSSNRPLQLTGEQEDFRAFGSTLKGSLHERCEAQGIPGVHLDVRTPLQ